MPDLRWESLAAPIPPAHVQWRQDGRPVQRDGKYFARFVAFVDAQFVRERLDKENAGQWSTKLELLPAMTADANGEALDEPCAFKCALTVASVTREDVGTGRDYKTAASDAFKRAAVRFGIAHELYAYEQNWVQVDGDGKYAKPLEDPGEAYARRMQRSGAKAYDGGEARSQSQPGQASATPPSSAPSHENGDGPRAIDEPSCPKCGGRMWDNRLSKRNPKAPDYKCRSRSCDGVVWPVKRGGGLRQNADEPPMDEAPPYDDDPRSLPF